METGAAQQIVTSLRELCRNACDIAKTANRNRKPLGGSNPYGNRFHNAVVAITKAENELSRIMAAAPIDEAAKGQITAHLVRLKATDTPPPSREQALKELNFLFETVLLPSVENLVASPVPRTEQVLPMAVLAGVRRGYLHKIIIQANGCYEHQWYDACSVMIRRFIETLIIEVYEATGKIDDIKDGNGDILMLKDLIQRFLADPTWTLGREVKRELPKIKALGDRSAHTRRYIAVKGYVDEVLPGLRVTADELLHLAGLK